MYKNNKIIALITARGGSKGLPRKNLLNLAGKPLIAWTILAAKKSVYIDRIILSSDDNEIIDISRKYGAEVFFKRPKSLALDETPSIDVAKHAIEWLKKEKNESYDYLLLLQPTSPLRNSLHIDQAILLLDSAKEKNIDSIISVSEPNVMPYNMKVLNSKGLLIDFLQDNKYTRRQDMPTVFGVNGAIYLTKIDTIIKDNNFFGKRCKPFIMEKKYSIDIDDEFDFNFAYYLIMKMAIKAF